LHAVPNATESPSASRSEMRSKEVGAPFSTVEGGGDEAAIVVATIGAAFVVVGAGIVVVECVTAADVVGAGIVVVALGIDVVEVGAALVVGAVVAVAERAALEHDETAIASAMTSHDPIARRRIAERRPGRSARCVPLTAPKLPAGRDRDRSADRDARRAAHRNGCAYRGKAQT
jgi:hypothetical protein